MASIAEKLSDIVVLTSDNPRTEDPNMILEEMKKGINGNDRNVFTIVDRREGIKLGCTLAKKGDIVLIAGKGHETYQEINHVKHHFDDKEEIMKY